MSREAAEVDVMQPLIEEHLEAIRALRREYGVAKLELFGSAATYVFDPERSDVDFIVHYPDHYDFGPLLARYFELRNRLQALLGRPVDLVMASAMRKPRFIESANLTRQVMFDAAGCTGPVQGAAGFITEPPRAAGGKPPVTVTRA